VDKEHASRTERGGGRRARASERERERERVGGSVKLDGTSGRGRLAEGETERARAVERDRGGGQGQGGAAGVRGRERERERERGFPLGGRTRYRAQDPAVPKKEEARRRGRERERDRGREWERVRERARERARERESEEAESRGWRGPRAANSRCLRLHSGPPSPAEVAAMINSAVQVLLAGMGYWGGDGAAWRVGHEVGGGGWSGEECQPTWPRRGVDLSAGARRSAPVRGEGGG
jgi:hypothetical protein